MANMTSYELGWIITSIKDINQVSIKAEANEDENGLWIPNEQGQPLKGPNGDTLYLEVGQNCLFVSIDSLEHGYCLEGLVEPHQTKNAIARYLEQLDPIAYEDGELAIIFGVIEATR